MLNRLIVTFVLIVSFGLAQIGAVQHRIYHYTDVVSQNQQQDSEKNNQKDHPQHKQVCEKCISYAELSNILQNANIAIAAFVSSNLNINTYSQTPSHLKLTTNTARAPPTHI